MLTRRLWLIYDFVAAGKVVADIGTDHGYLIGELVGSGKCPCGYASDIHPKPLEKAREWIEKRGLSGRIQLLCCDGLEGVPMEQVEEVVIAGMGGELIARILSQCPQVKSGKVGLVLQPMTRAPQLRSWLYENGFALTREEAVEEKGFCYSVMRAEYTGLCRRLTEGEARMGLLPFVGGEAAGKYLRRQRDVLAGILEQTARSGRMAEETRRYRQLLEELDRALSSRPE